MGRGRVRRCWRGIPQRESLGGAEMVEPRGRVHEPAANLAGGGMPDVAFCEGGIMIELNRIKAVLYLLALKEYTKIFISNITRSVADFWYHKSIIQSN